MQLWRRAESARVAEERTLGVLACEVEACTEMTEWWEVAARERKKPIGYHQSTTARGQEPRRQARGSAMRISKRAAALLIAVITALALSACEGAPDVLDADEPQAQQTTFNIRTHPGQGTTPGGAIWSVSLDEFTDERQSLVGSPTESSSSLYEPRLVLGCGWNGTVLLAFFQDLPVSDINDGWSTTIRWDSLTPQTTRLNENDNDQTAFLASPTRYRRYVTNHDTLRVRFVGYFDTVTATIDVSAMRNAPTWPNILACGN